MQKKRGVKKAAMYCKIIVSGHITEVTKYERLNVTGGGAHERTGENSQHNYSRTQKRRRDSIRQLICTNFDKANSKFVTLTFGNKMGFDIKDVKACNAYFRKFVLRVKYRFPDFKYLAVIEFQDKNDRGAVHYHMVCNLPFVKKAELAQLWGAGFVKINRIDKVDNVGAYVVKYMNKDIDDKRLCGLKAYNCSKGLDKPVEVCSWRQEDTEAYEAIRQLAESKSPSYAATYESEYAGRIEYYQFNDARAKGGSSADYKPKRKVKNCQA